MNKIDVAVFSVYGFFFINRHKVHSARGDWRPPEDFKVTFNRKQKNGDEKTYDKV